MTNIASSMSLEQSTTIFVFVLSLVVLKEPFKVFKLFSVLICIVGVVLVAVGDQLETSDDDSSLSKLESSFYILEIAY